MTIDTKELRELAKGATPGPWHAEPFSRAGDQPPMWRGRVFFLGADNPKTNTRDCDLTVADARFIAAANPQTVVALLDDNAQLREACATWQNHFTDTPGLAAANAEIVSLRSQLAANAKKLTELWSLCVECGPNVSTDEDGCCSMCGGTAIGTWLDASQGRETPAVNSALDKLRAELEAMTAARDEACTWIVAATGSKGDMGAEAKKRFRDKADELRKVGAK